MMVYFDFCMPERLLLGELGVIVEQLHKDPLEIMGMTAKGASSSAASCTPSTT